MPSRHLWKAIATISLTDCATAGFEVKGLAACSPVVEYSLEFQAQVAAELALLPDGSIVDCGQLSYHSGRERLPFDALFGEVDSDRKRVGVLPVHCLNARSRADGPERPTCSAICAIGVLVFDRRSTVTLRRMSSFI